MEENRSYILPYDCMYLGLPMPYIAPNQSRYHNLGQNAFLYPTQEYYDKRPGFIGDWGPRQEGCRDIPRVYPLDKQGPVRSKRRM
jgi:hypothetical protein